MINKKRRLKPVVTSMKVDFDKKAPSLVPTESTNERTKNSKNIDQAFIGTKEWMGHRCLKRKDEIGFDSH